jgi:DNA-binding response OmpR family regulator
LIVEDDIRLADLLAEYLTAAGFQVGHIARGDLASARILSDMPDLVVLDLMLPGLNGVGVLQAIRPRYAGPVLMLTAQRDDIEQVGGLEAGADDYVVKPCKPRVLLARIRALLRRAGEGTNGATEPSEDALELGSLCVDRGRREVRVDGARVDLTSTEFEVAWSLASRCGSIVTREQLFLEVRGVAYDGLDRTIDVHVSRVRRKLTAAGLQDPRIVGVRGEGYQLTQPRTD